MPTIVRVEHRYVKVFLVNDDVDTYMAVLRKRRQGLGSHQRGLAGGKPGALPHLAEAGPPGAQAYSRDLTTLIDYDESAINGFYPYLFEWTDNLHFLRTPDDVIAEPAKRAAIEAAVARRFRGEGWKGDGLLALLWLPSFVFPLSANIPPEGVLVWHVKQHEDGISWLLSPIPLPFVSLGPD